MKISIKYKIFLVLVLLPFLGIGLYFVNVGSLLKEDKLAYMYEGGAGQALDLSGNYHDKITSLNYVAGGLLALNVVDKNEHNRLDGLMRNYFLSTSYIRKVEVYNESSNWQLIYSYSGQDLKISSDLFKNDFFSKIAENKYLIELVSEKDDVISFVYRPKNKSKVIRFIISSSALFSSEKSKNNTAFESAVLYNSNVLFGNINKEAKIIIEEKAKLLKDATSTLEVGDSIYSIRKTSNLVFVTSVSKYKMFAPIRYLYRKSFLFFIAILSGGIVISTLASKRMTRNISKLHEAVVNFSEKNFSFVVDVRSNDEIGDFAVAFNNMQGRIQELFSQLEEYNRSLEIKVEERTLELKNAMVLQRSILDSVDQGLVLVDKDLKIAPIYSRASVEIFDGNPDSMDLGGLVHVPQDESDSVFTLAKMSLDGDMSFDDFRQTAPSSFINKNNSYVELSYHPIVEEHASNGFVVVASDKTEEIVAINAAENEKSKVKSYVKLIENPDRYSSFVEYLNKEADDLTLLIDDKLKLSHEDLFKKIHTLKGNASLYFIKNVVEKAHKLETSISNSSAIDRNVFDGIVQLIQEIKSYETEFNDSLIVKEINKIKNRYLINPREIEYLNKLAKMDSAVVNYLTNKSKYKLASSYLEELCSVTISFAQMIDKNVNCRFDLQSDFVLKKEFTDELDTYLVHVIKNSLDHGIESVEQRKVSGKAAVGAVSLKSGTFNNKLFFEISDDGKGIDVDLLREKLSAKGHDVSAMSEDEIIQSIFMDDISTKTEVTEFSGRGVGMGAVLGWVKNAGGQISIKTQKNQGTTFQLIFPDSNIVKIS